MLRWRGASDAIDAPGWAAQVTKPPRRRIQKAHQWNPQVPPQLVPGTIFSTYVLPNAETRPRRIAITSDDVLWYSEYSRGYLSRLDPATGKATEWPSPGGPASQPYVIHALNDILWYSESAVKPNTLVRFDLKTEKFQTWMISSGGGVVRNMDATRDGNLALACSGVNPIARIQIQ
jgi:virginiamycin B lyase